MKQQLGSYSWSDFANSCGLVVVGVTAVEEIQAVLPTRPIIHKLYKLCDFTKKHSCEASETLGEALVTRLALMPSVHPKFYTEQSTRRCRSPDSSHRMRGGWTLRCPGLRSMLHAEETGWVLAKGMSA